MIITLLTDYGSDDEFAGICHSVIAGIAPEARVIDLTHGIGRHDIRHGALVLRNALDYVPAGIHVAVVDPMVGTPRRALALRCADGRVLVGPDNGLLLPAAQRAGGIVLAVDITTSPTVSNRFQRLSTVATCSRRSPRSSPPGLSSPKPERCSTRPSS